MNIVPNWQKNSGKNKKTKGLCKAQIKARKQSLRTLLNKFPKCKN